VTPGGLVFFLELLEPDRSAAAAVKSYRGLHGPFDGWLIDPKPGHDPARPDELRPSGDSRRCLGKTTTHVKKDKVHLPRPDLGIIEMSAGIYEDFPEQIPFVESRAESLQFLRAPLRDRVDDAAASKQIETRMTIVGTDVDRMERMERSERGMGSAIITDQAPH
jgi:hypothetical protein